MSVFFDAAVVLIIVATSLFGYHKGFFKYVITMLGTVVAVIVAFAASDLLTEPVYERYVKESLNSAVMSAVENVDINKTVKNALEQAGIEVSISEDDIQKLVEKGGNIADNAEKMILEKGGSSETAKKVKNKFSVNVDNDVIKSLSDFSGNKKISKVIDSMSITGEQLGETAKLISSGKKQEAAEYMTDNVFSPAVRSVIKLVVFFIAFAVASVVIKLILYISGIFQRIHVVSMANHFGGMLIGLVKGCLYVALIAFLVSIVVNATDNNMDILNVETADKTYLFKYFFDFFYK